MIEYIILIPCFNDWECLKLLIPKIDEKLKKIQDQVSILIVNDGSTIQNNLSFNNISNLKRIEVLNLKKNVKAQIAIATGLEYLKNKNFNGGIIVMDADGQDDPENIVDLINTSKVKPEQTITINRTKREDELLFKIFYQFYLFVTFIFTLKYMRFGVFSYLHSISLDKILSTNDINMAYAASLAKHFRNKNIIYAPRKKRLIDKSKNNYISLTYYALKIISVFRYMVLINSIILFFFIFLLSDILFQFPVHVFFFVAILFFDLIVFILPYKVNRSSLVNRLENIKNVENLKN